VPKVFSYDVRDEFFELVCGGFSLIRAARVVGVSDETVSSWWRSSGLVTPVIQLGAIGGLPGTAPPGVPGVQGPGEPARKRRPLTSEDRSAIAVGLMCNCSYTQIGSMIARDKSVICREVARNRGRDGSYWAPVAHRGAHERRRRPKAFKLAQNPALCRRIEAWMDDGWSPGVIARILRADAGSNMMGRVSHETIYRALYVQTRGGLRADLHRQLSLKRSQRKACTSAGRGGAHTYDHAMKISQRPAQVADRAVPGHWEGDLIMGPSNRSAIGTLVERATRFVILLHLPERHDAPAVAEAMIREMSKLPHHLRRSITWDRGSELADYVDIQLQLQAPVYFCDPHSPWQRGSNENTNRLLRHWFEKGTDLSTHSPEDLTRIAATLNARPRPTLDMKTPAQALAQLLATPAAA